MTTALLVVGAIALYAFIGGIVYYVLEDPTSDDVDAIAAGCLWPLFLALGAVLVTPVMLGRLAVNRARAWRASRRLPRATVVKR